MPLDLVEQVEREASLRDARLSVSARRERGVVHTPGALARFVAAQVERLVRELGLEGLGDARLCIVDPATGPGVFLAAVIERLAPGASSSLLGLDVDAGALERAREVLEPAASRVGARLSLHHGNALVSLPAVGDAHAVLVLGNPPWAGRSANRDAALAEALLEDFRRDGEGRPLGERKIGVLSDDYVRFVRWSLELLRRAPLGGVLGLVTNASFVDGPVHRGMRAALARWLDRVELFDLGGSALVARRSGARDDNLFGVRPAAVITLGLRRAAAEPRAASWSRVTLRGSRDEKLARLAQGSLDVREERLEGARLVPLARAAPPDWPTLDRWIPFHREGVQTNRDALVVDTDRARLAARLLALASGEHALPPPSAHFDPEAARAALGRALEHRSADSMIAPLAYRPLDDRHHVTLGALCHRPRPELAAALAASRFALVTVRKDRGDADAQHLAIVRDALDNCFLSARSSCRARAFPTHTPEGEPNVARPIAERAAERVGREIGSDEALLWIAAVLASDAHRARLGAERFADYPPIPLPRDAAVFERAIAAARAFEDAWCAPSSPHPAVRRLVPEAPRARLRADVERGVLLAGKQPILEAPPDALGLVVGHHAVLAARVASRGLDGIEAAASTAVRVASAMHALATSIDAAGLE